METPLLFDDQVIECTIQLCSLQYQWMRIRFHHAGNKMDAINRKWKEKLKRYSESGYFNTQEIYQIADVHVPESLTSF